MCTVWAFSFSKTIYNQPLWEGHKLQPIFYLFNHYNVSSHNYGIDQNTPPELAHKPGTPSMVHWHRKEYWHRKKAVDASSEIKEHSQVYEPNI